MLCFSKSTIPGSSKLKYDWHFSSKSLSINIAFNARLAQSGENH